MVMVSEREQLACLVQQWNENRLDLFHLSYPTEDLEVEGVMRFYFQKMTDYMAQMLNELMGSQRDANPGERREIRYDDPNVCTDFLVGFCTHDIFRNTKNDLGFCKYTTHDENLKNSYKNSDKKWRMGFEKRFLERIRRIHEDVRRKIQKHEDRLAVTQGESKSAEETFGQKILEIEQRREQLTKKMEDLMDEAALEGEKGNVDAGVVEWLAHEERQDGGFPEPHSRDELVTLLSRMGAAQTGPLATRTRARYALFLEADDDAIRPLRDQRRVMEEWIRGVLTELGGESAARNTTFLMAACDGLLLHRLTVDPDVPIDDVIARAVDAALRT